MAIECSINDQEGQNRGAFPVERLHVQRLAMKARPKKPDQGNFLFQDLLEQLNPRDPLFKLAGPPCSP